MKLITYIFIILSLFFCSNSFAQDCDTKADREQARNYVSEGVKYLNAEKYEDAIECYKNAIAYCPKYWYAYANWGITLIKSALNEKNTVRIEEGINKLKIAVELSNENTSILLHLGSAMGVLGRINNNKEQIEKGLAIIESIENEKDLPSYFYSNKGAIIINLSVTENNLSENEYNIAYLLYKAYPTAPEEAAINLACLYSLLNKKKEAIMWLKEALLTQKINLDKINSEEDLDNIRNKKEYKELIKIRSEYEKELQLLSKKYDDSDFIYSDIKEELSEKYLNKLDNYYTTNKSCTRLKETPSDLGESALWKCIRKNLKIPTEAYKYNISGTVSVQFNIRHGKAENIKVIKSIYKNHKLSKEYDKEAIRIVKLLRWVPNKTSSPCQILDIHFNPRESATCTDL